MNTVRLDQCAFVAWRNGGGRTRELLAWPSAADWQVRVTIAEIEADGPFSAFTGIDRCFAVLEGAGVVLSLPAGERRLTAGDDAAAFPGEAAPMCRLIDGPTRDLNLMVRRGAGTASMQRKPASGARWHGVFADGILHWSDNPLEALPSVTGWYLSV